MNIVSIDIGYHNLGIVDAYIDEKYDIHVQYVNVIDLKKLPHKRIPRIECNLEHTNEVADLIAHFIQEYGHYLEKADKLLLERQPPTGLTQIETLLLYLYRYKTVLVSPNSMHKHFHIGQLEYEKRKEKTIQFAQDFLENFKEYQMYDRKHDIADAVCMIIFYIHSSKRKFQLQLIDRTLPFSNYKYDPSNI